MNYRNKLACVNKLYLCYCVPALSFFTLLPCPSPASRGKQGSRDTSRRPPQLEKKGDMTGCLFALAVFYTSIELILGLVLGMIYVCWVQGVGYIGATVFMCLI